jgi:hypothetical protein
MRPCLLRGRLSPAASEHQRRPSMRRRPRRGQQIRCRNPGSGPSAATVAPCSTVDQQVCAAVAGDIVDFVGDQPRRSGPRWRRYAVPRVRRQCTHTIAHRTPIWSFARTPSCAIRRRCDPRSPRGPDRSAAALQHNGLFRRAARQRVRTPRRYGGAVCETAHHAMPNGLPALSPRGVIAPAHRPSSSLLRQCSVRHRRRRWRR